MSRKLLFFSAKWCATCHYIKDKIPIDHIAIDCDEDNETAIKYDVMGLPLFIAVDNDGTEIARCKITNMDALKRWWDSLT